MRLRLAFLFCVFALCAQSVLCPTRGQAQITRESYPERWQVKVPEGTALAQIRDTYEKRRTIRMAVTDLQDQSPHPFWFRAYLRDHFPQLPTSGPYQYPRVAQQILEWMLAHPDLRVPAAAKASSVAQPARTVTVGNNINISSIDERHSESFAAVDPSSPQYVIAASNNITGSGRQKEFYSTNSGATWKTTELPLATGVAFHSDPAVAFTTDGVAWAATLGINNTGSSILVQVYKSTDHGATWQFVATVSSGTNNDKELMAVDTHASSPFKDNIYVAWDVPGAGIRFARSTDKGATWAAPMSLSSDAAIGTHLATGPAGELYVAWPDTATRQLKIRKSTDGGASFGPTLVIVTTNTPYEVAIPAMCSRQALIYLSVGVDRSNGPRKGTVYASWTDRDGANPDPGCNGISSVSNTNVYLGASTDGGNTWSTPKIVHSNPASTDQFNQWMDVDPNDGKVHVIFYDTREDAGRKKTNVYYVASTDGGNTWIDETKVTTAQTDETVSGADSGNQYGDYNGLVAYRQVVHPVWTDRRTGVPGGKEQIFTAKLDTSGASLPLCIRFPRLCVDPDFRPGGLVLLCQRIPCVVVDFVPRNCLLKFPCPGCPPRGLCPPFYNVFLDGLDNAWTVSLAGPKGERVAYQLFRGEKGVVLSFRPSKELFKEGKIGNYFLTFRLKPTGKTGVKYEVKTSLDVSDRPYEPAPAAKRK